MCNMDPRIQNLVDSNLFVSKTLVINIEVTEYFWRKEWVQKRSKYSSYLKNIFLIDLKKCPVHHVHNLVKVLFVYNRVNIVINKEQVTKTHISKLKTNLGEASIFSFRYLSLDSMQPCQKKESVSHSPVILINSSYSWSKIIRKRDKNYEYFLLNYR